MTVVDAATVRAMDAAAIAAGTSGNTLMCRAGLGCAAILRELLSTRYAGHCRQLVILCGPGNNGGDGFVIAGALAAEMPVQLFSSHPRTAFKGDARHYAERLPATVPWRWGHTLPDEFLTPGTIVVDAMLGTGATGPLRPPFDAWVPQLNAAGLPVVAIDLPSGLNASTGEVASDAVNADCTLTIGAPKTGLYVGPGASRAGIIRFVNIGLDVPDQAQTAFTTLLEQEVRNLLPPLPPTRHKGTMGRVTIVGGCRRYRGAPILAARAAIRAGAGLVAAVVPAGARVSADPAAIMTYPLGLDNQITHRPIADGPLTDLLDAADALVLGPGLGRTPPALAFVAPLLQHPTPKVIDADALLAIDPAAPPTGPAIITPHPGEFHTLAERCQLTVPDDRLAAASAMARHLNLVVVLKGHRTVIARPDGPPSVCGRGCAALATGGTGDALAGLTGTLLARFPDDPFTAARIAVWIHAAASESIPLGTAGLIADDLPDAVATILRQLNPAT